MLFCDFHLQSFPLNECYIEENGNTKSAFHLWSNLLTRLKSVSAAVVVLCGFQMV